MYASYFGFREKPFNVTPDPRFVYMNPVYREAYASLLAGIRERKGFIALTGEVGTGKTTLLRMLMKNLEATVRFVYFYNTTLSFEELLTFACEELGLEVKGGGRLRKIQALNDFLIDQLRKGGTGALLIDEAQHLSEHVLENLRLLSNLETGTEKLLQIVLVGQPELEAKLAQPSLRQLKQRVSVQCHLDRLKEREIKSYIQFRLESVGYQGKDVFNAGALQRIAHYSDGIPRLINIVCDNALTIAYATSQRTVTADIIEEVARDLGLRRTAPAPALPVEPASEAPVVAPAAPAAAEESDRPRRTRARETHGPRRVLVGGAALAGVALAGIAVGASARHLPDLAIDLPGRVGGAGAAAADGVGAAWRGARAEVGELVDRWFGRTATAATPAAAPAPSAPAEALRADAPPVSASPAGTALPPAAGTPPAAIASAAPASTAEAPVALPPAPERTAPATAPALAPREAAAQPDATAPTAVAPRPAPTAPRELPAAASRETGPAGREQAPAPGREVRTAAVPPGLAAGERPVTIPQGGTVSDIAYRRYGHYSTLAVDLIKEFNPHVDDLDWIKAGDRLWLPPLTQDTLMRRQPDGSYRLVVASFLSPLAAEKLSESIRRRGFEVRVTPRQVTSQLSLYRVELTGVQSRDAAENAWRTALANCWVFIADAPCERTSP